MLQWLANLGLALDRAFERRLRRASGLDQPQQRHAPVQPIDEPDQEGTEISNVARGVDVGGAASLRPALAAELSADLPPPPALRQALAPAAPAAEKDEEEGTITNL